MVLPLLLPALGGLLSTIGSAGAAGLGAAGSGLAAGAGAAGSGLAAGAGALGSGIGSGLSALGAVPGLAPGAGIGALTGGGASALQGGDAGDIAKGAALGGVTGGLGGAAMGGLGKLAGGFAPGSTGSTAASGASSGASASTPMGVSHPFANMGEAAARSSQVGVSHPFANMGEAAARSSQGASASSAPSPFTPTSAGTSAPSVPMEDSVTAPAAIDAKAKPPGVADFNAITGESPLTVGEKARDLGSGLFRGLTGETPNAEGLKALGGGIGRSVGGNVLGSLATRGLFEAGLDPKSADAAGDGVSSTITGAPKRREARERQAQAAQDSMKFTKMVELLNQNDINAGPGKSPEPIGNPPAGPPTIDTNILNTSAPIGDRINEVLGRSRANNVDVAGMLGSKKEMSLQQQLAEAANRKGLPRASGQRSLQRKTNRVQSRLAEALESAT